MTKGRFHKCIAWLLVIVFVCSTVFVSAGTAEAANAGKKIKSIAVSAGGEKVTKKTVTLRRGAKTTLKVSASPHEAKKHITYKSSKKSVAVVSQKGRVTAKKAGTAKITVTVSGNGYKKKTAWVKIQVVNSYDTAPDETDANTPEPNVPTPEPDTPKPDIPAPVPDTPEPDMPAPTPDIQPSVTDNGKSLVVYFSRTGNTKLVAEEIQSLTGSDLVELKTVIPYPDSYDDCLAQAQEERAKSARPELSTTVSNMPEYDTVYVGYPIWCYTAPMAIFTFLESYDFTWKTVIPFCTSGSSSITQSVTEIRSVCSGNVLDGFRAGGSETVEEWLARIGQIGNQNTTDNNVLVAYFSLSGNTSSSKEEQSGNMDAVSSASVVTEGEDAYGNTEYIAKLIQKKTGGTLHQIQTKETYSTDFDEVVDQNHNEMNASSLPELKDSDLDVRRYDIVFIGYPVWASTIPRAIHSFLNRYDLSGKTVIPFCTHNGYGSGNSYGTIASLCSDATNLNGLAVAASGQYSFEDGEITYCAQNNTIAIFYAQTSRPNLTMEVVPIGKVTSDLSVFDTLPSRAEFTFSMK